VIKLLLAGFSLILFFGIYTKNASAQQPEYGKVIAHVYEDSNKNGVKDNGEIGIDSFNVRLHVGQNCTGQIHWYINTYPSGDAPMGSFSPFIPVGEYSIDASPHVGWIATTPACTNVQINSSEINTYDFGMFKTPIPDHYTQIDPIWSNQTYDHADSIRSFFCGSTIGQCGCAITAATALLTSYSVYSSPEGTDTTPETLNSWLKNRPHGYINGGINWTEVAKYAYEANRIYDSPKIDYKGRINFTDFTTLKTDLDSQKPVILEVNNQGSMHFVLAGSYLNNQFNIHDPLVEEYYTTLDKYNNTFVGMRRYELTNTDLSAILLAIPAPAKIMITDSQGRKLGQDPNNGAIFNEISGGNYYLEAPIGNFNDPNLPQVPEGQGTYFIEILDPKQDAYSIQIYGENKKATIIAYDKEANDKNATFDINGLLKVNLQYNPTNINDITITKPEQVIKIDAKVSNSKVEINVTNQQGFDVEDVVLSSLTIGQNHYPPAKTKLKDKEGKPKKNTKLEIILKTKNIGPFTENPVCLYGQTKNGGLFKGCDHIRVHR